MSSRQLDNGHYSTSYDVIRGIFGTLGITLLPIIIISTIYYSYKINEFPIKGREPKLVIISNIFAILGFILTLIFVLMREEFPCALHQWGRLLVVTALCAIYIIRCSVLVFKTQLTFELCRDEINRIHGDSREQSSYSIITPDNSQDNNNDDNIDDDHKNIERTETKVYAKEPAGFFVQHRHWLNNKNIIRGVFCIFFAFFVPGVGVFLFMDNLGISEKNDCNLTGANVFLVAEALIAAFIYAGLALSLREVVENFHITTELKLTAFASSICIICVIAAIPQTIFPFHHLCYILLLSSCCLISTLYPIKLYLQEKHQRLFRPTPTDSKLTTMEEIFEHPDAVHLFKLHLATEFSLENYIFIAEVDGFKQDIERLKSKLANNTNSNIDEKFDQDNNNDAELSLSNNMISQLANIPNSSASSISLEPLSISKQVSCQFDLDLNGINALAWTCAYYIYQLFVSDNGLYQVNLPYNIRNEMRSVFTFTRRQSFQRDTAHGFSNNQVGNDLSTPLLDGLDELPYIPNEAPPIEIFDRAKVCILDLMNRDTFPRFMQTSEFLKLRRHIITESQRISIQQKFSNM